MKPSKSVLLFAIMLVFVPACGVGSAAEPAPGQLETIVAATLSQYTKSAPPATEPFTPIPTLTPEWSGGVFLYTNVDNLNLRTRPGTLFPVSRVMPKNTRLEVLGRAPGGEWLNVLNDESILGWVQAEFMAGGFDGPPPPVVEPKDVLLVSGRVVDESGSAVSGIVFAIVQGSRRVDAATDDAGQFYAYLPKSMQGSWSVEYVSASCTSNAMDLGCVCSNGNCGKPEPVSQSVTLPSNSVLPFMWKK